MAEDTPKINTFFLKLTYYISLLTVSSSIYVSSYWSEFGIDIFPYLQLSQIPLYGLSFIIGDFIPTLFIMFVIFFLLEEKASIRWIHQLYQFY